MVGRSVGNLPPPRPSPPPLPGRIVVPTGTFLSSYEVLYQEHATFKRVGLVNVRTAKLQKLLNRIRISNKAVSLSYSNIVLINLGAQGVVSNNAVNWARHRGVNTEFAGKKV